MGNAGRKRCRIAFGRCEQGVKKWSVDGEKCFKYWTFLTTDCAVCVQVCPYNRGDGVFDVLWKALAGTRLRHVMKALHVRQLDSKRGTRAWAGLSTVGRKLKPVRWWAGEEEAVEEARRPRAKATRKPKKKRRAGGKAWKSKATKDGTTAREGAATRKKETAPR